MSLIPSTRTRTPFEVGRSGIRCPSFGDLSGGGGSKSEKVDSFINTVSKEARDGNPFGSLSNARPRSTFVAGVIQGHKPYKCQQPRAEHPHTLKRHR